MSKCQCNNCQTFQRPSANHAPWDGNLAAQVIIAGTNGLPVCAAEIVIKSLPLLVEPWMLQKVLLNASKELTKFITNASEGKVLN